LSINFNQTDITMNNLFVPNYLSLFYEGDEVIEVLEKSSSNGSGETLHKFKLIIDDKIKRSQDLDLLESLQQDIKSSHISIREVQGGIHVVTSLRFLNGKLGDLFLGNYNNFDETQTPGKFYVGFFIKSILYMTNYYYFIRNESDIRIQKDAFQTVFNGRANTYATFVSIFKDMETYLVKFGLLEFLFKYDNNFGHYVFQESAFLSLYSNEINSLDRYNELKV